MTDLLTLVEEERLDELLRVVTIADIAEAWCRYSSSQAAEAQDEDGPDWWAIQLWMTPAWWSHPELVRVGLLALVDCAPDDDVLSHVSAGPMESFISSSARDLDWLEEQARTSEKFRSALGRVWIWDLPETVARRVERAAGTTLPLPD